jgi:hypothetical protein
MAEPNLIEREVGLLRDLARLSIERAESEVQTASDFFRADNAAERAYQAAREQLAKRRAAEEDSARAEHEQALQAAHNKIVMGRADADYTFEQARTGALERYKAEKEAADREHEEARWKVDAVLDGVLTGAKKRVEDFEAQLQAEEVVLGPLLGEAHHLLDRYHRWAPPGPAPEVTTPELLPGETFPKCEAARVELEAVVLKFRHLGLPKFAREGGGIFIAVVLALVGAIGGGFGLGWTVAAPVLGLLGAIAGGAITWWLNKHGRAVVAPLHADLARTAAYTEMIGPKCREVERAHAKSLLVEARRVHKEDTRQIDRTHAKRLAVVQETRDDALESSKRRHEGILATLGPERDAAMKTADDALAARLADIQARADATARQDEGSYKAQKRAAQERRDRDWSALATAWRQGMEHVFSECNFLNRTAERIFPDWERPDWVELPPPSSVPPAQRIGTIHVDRAKIEAALPDDERLRIGPNEFDLPALIKFPERGSLLIRASEEGREVAADVLQAAMLRLLTSIPPSKVRFTIIDPVGLGQHFAAFMHLADYDEQLVASRIWSETAHIEKRLVDLTEHMENVIQKYLRNEYDTIEEYNAQAGEVAEPYQVLVVANFPANFNDNSARRLASIATSGVRCGVLTLISVDTKQPMPSGFDLKDLEKHATQLFWRDKRLNWKDEELGKYPLTLDRPPSAERYTEVLQVIGARAKEAGRVEVPFEVIAPQAEQYWTWDSRPGIDVPLGRAGATRLQHLSLGEGTSQHVLIAGRTGSGKSTLLHALITNLALRYSPEEVELYLIDFKKGVEFKTYATHALPHARVVAVESEREFGLSVLQRLDVELKLRGDRFRDAGAQNVQAYRDATGLPCPRILLIVDEFQEFFVEDDKLSQEATLLLDRLVRQGRAFGIHVHLGSQTLGGAYSLARSTLSQMGVRIALQCSENDAHLILSEENSAARLLSRPGEAIYNDANGLIEGNHPFQVVWLSESKREDYLKLVHDMDRSRRNGASERPMIVFEGTAPADVEKNPQLAALLDAPSWPGEAPAPRAWFGEAIAIKDPTSAPLRRQGGSNVLIVGQQDEAALGILCAALAGLAAQHDPASARFYVLDGTPADSSRVGTFARLAEALPHSVRVGGIRDVPAFLNELAEEVTRRQEADEPSNAYLFIYDLQRFRELRKAEDDYGYGGFSSSDASPSPAKQFATVLREGTTLGVHTLTWCDSLNNVNRTFDRQTLREFELRVLFQMSANDSSTLIDSPAAGRLGPHRALFASEELGVIEKFRPYRSPTTDWLDRLRERLGGRATVPVGSPD